MKKWKVLGILAFVLFPGMLLFQWVQYVIAGAALLNSYVTGQKAQDSADKAMKRSQQFSEQMYKDWQELYGPLEKELVKTVGLPLEEQPGYKRAVGILERGYATADAALRRRGVIQGPHGTGVDAARRTSAYYNRIGARAGLRASGEQSRLSNMMAAARLGRNTPEAAKMLQNTYGSIAGYRAGQATQAGSDLASSAGNLAMLYMLYGGGKTDPVTQGIRDANNNTGTRSDTIPMDVTG